ncbi:methionine biosynthesis protein MetW [Novimethylophilus kurashikiensis]|uniref:Methionine biosynthesis protein MetW n=1 Tax=Novimethylophilus kurashikiensis TaxID=1825523 RepID=A0A2R5F5S7_9PROT|nr:methionine biosynthesis protein MetW [Novimethylophilus kurashikiensis]GBG13682.1 methionine biosynthesis protein MetW [Novimethylophilus kurashikiensis]
MTHVPAQAHQHFAEAATERRDFAAIARWIAPGSKVLDLGCGDGSLLGYLRDTLNVRGYGVEKEDANVLACVKNGINVIQMNLEEGLSGFEANSFDVVILSQTLQAVYQTEGIVLEMLRVGKEVIVTFPNFGYWKHRLNIAAGRMPVSKSLPYQWYDTPNVHMCTIRDFDVFCEGHGIQVKERLVMADGKEVDFMPNLLGNLAMYRFQTA